MRFFTASTLVLILSKDERSQNSHSEFQNQAPKRGKKSNAFNGLCKKIVNVNSYVNFK